MYINGLPVVDATKPRNINIIKADIKKATAKDHHNCAIAMSCKRLTGCVDAAVYMSRTYLKFEGKDYWERYVTPEYLRREITAIDRGGGFGVGKHRLLPLSPSVRKHAWPAGNKTKNGKPSIGKYTQANVMRHQHRINRITGVRSAMPASGIVEFPESKKTGRK